MIAHMIKLIAATNNAHKLKEFREILGSAFDIRSLSEEGFSIEVEEDQDTFLGNALKKAREVARLTSHAALSDDSGLLVDALGGAPGVYSARYSGDNATDESNREKLLREMAPFTDPDARGASFHSSVVICFPDGETITGEGDTRGRILFEETGENGFGYDSLFYSYDLGKSFGIATAEEKNSVSHRSRALTDLKSKLSSFISED